ncbi:Flp pilus assembly protein CpaB [Phenylobacterium sp.]|uniref:Flp pilus assembly protein CpaB n=1 Tax=Phenylobacterium sp. TaxID=1871053 RepID=UPI002F9257C3
MLTANRVKLLGLALLLSGGTVVMTQQWLQGAVEKAAQEASSRSPGFAPVSGKRVLVANAALPAGTILQPQHLRWQAWPAEAPVNGYLTEANTQIPKVTGAVVRTSLGPGEPLSPDRIAFPGDRSILAAVLRPGYRAMTVNVSAATAVGGFVMPGDHVDVVLSRIIEPTGAGGQRRVIGETVLTDVRVLGVDQRTYDGKKDVVVPQTATLEVTPKGAEVIAVVSELGKLSLSLRSLATSDAPVAEARRVTRTSDREAIGAPPPRTPRPAASKPAAPAADPNVTKVEVVRGSQTLTLGVPSERGGS